MKFDQFKNIFIQNVCRKWGRQTSSKPPLFFKKSLIWSWNRWSAPSFQYILVVLDLNIQWEQTVWNFSLSICDFSRKHSSLYILLSLLLEISGNICIVIVCFPVFDVTNFQSYLSFIIKLFSYMAKKSEQKCKYLENEKSF